MDTQIVGVVNKDDDTSTLADDSNSVSIDDTSNLELEGIVGYVNYSLQQIACPECVGATQELTVTFSAEFHEPISGDHTGWIPAAGSCVENLQETSPSTNSVDIGNQLTVDGPVHSFVVPRTGQGAYHTSNIYETQYDREGLHTLSGDSVDGDFNFTSSRGFDYIEPVSLLYVDMSYAYQAPIYRSGMTFFWGPSGSEENFMIIVAVYSNNGISLLGYVACVGNDNGMMTIPSSYLSSYSPGNLVAVHLSRQKIELSPFDSLGGYVESHMEWEVVGTGHIE